MKSFKLMLCALIVCFLCSCGGVIGNIEKYEYKGISEQKLKGAIMDTYKKYPSFIPKDSSLYLIREEQDSYYFILNIGDEAYVFVCDIIPPDFGVGTELSLTTATKWGELMKLAPKMGFFEELKYQHLFEKNILPKIEAEIYR